MEIKAVLHEINGGPHKQYMNHSLPLQYVCLCARERPSEGERERERERERWEFQRSLRLTKLHNTSERVTEEERERERERERNGCARRKERRRVHK